MRTSPLSMGLVLPLLIGLSALVGVSCGGGGGAAPNTCGALLADCGGACVDLSLDPQNCGACGSECQGSEVCSAGACLDFCGDGLTVCDGVCVNTAINEQHCGGCGVACPPGVPCSGSACGGGEDCAALGLVDCNGVCVDTSSDPLHCGGCFIPCESGLCQGGFCQGACPPGLVNCGGACVDIFNDSFNCGDCFIDCGPQGFCAGGDCQFECPPGFEVCGDFCADTQNDPFNCGFCGNFCPSGQCVGGDCTGGCGEICGACTAPIDLGTLTPQSVFGSTIGLLDGLTSSCAGAGSPEQPFFFTAPTSGTYVFDTLGSSYDTVLAIRDLSCTEIGCNDDAMIGASQVAVFLFGGQEVLVVVDGWSGAQGNFQLNITGDAVGGCPDLVLPSMSPQTLTGSTVGGLDKVAPSCGLAGGADVVFEFTAPADALYTFDTFGSSFDTVLHAHNSVCGGVELGCSDDTMGSLSSQLTLQLALGQTVVVAVDGFGGAQGDFTFHITSPAVTCPSQVLAPMVPETVSGSTVGAPNNLQPGCVGAMGAEMTYSFTAPVSKSYTFSTLGSGYDTVLYVRNGACNGVELACNDDFNGLTSQVSTFLNQNQTVVVVVDGFGSGNYVLTVQ